MWDLPGHGLEPTSPALAGGFLTTAPPGKFPHKDVKAAIIIIINEVMVNTLETTEKTNSQQRKRNYKKKNLTGNSELKNTVSEIFKKSLHGVNHRT